MALQSLITLVLLATLPSAFSMGGRMLLLLCALMAIDLALCWLVPVQRLGRWLQLGYLIVQLGIASTAQIFVPSPVFSYVYLLIVLQAVYLFKPWQWLLFAGGVYALWSGSLMIASANLLEWLQSNLVLAFPVLCILAAATVYARQHQRRQQVQQLAQQVQQRYEQLVMLLRDAQQRAILEERHRIAQTVTYDIGNTLAQIEQSIANALSQAQNSLPRIEASMQQARASATLAMERLRDAVATLRHPARDEQAAAAPLQLSLPPNELMTLRSQRTLTWVMPGVFAAAAFFLMPLQRTVTPGAVALLTVCCVALVAGYVCTQRLRNPLLVQLSLAGQVAAVFGMVLATQALPLILGLLLVVWQIALRFSAGQIITFLVGVQAAIGLAMVRSFSLPNVDATQLLTFGVACLAVVGLVGTARRQLNSRYQTEARLKNLAQLTNEIDQQVQQIGTLAAALERTRVAREMHDDLGHQLVLLNVQLQLADDLLSDDPSAALEQLRATHAQLAATWASVLHTADIALDIDGPGLHSALEQLVQHCQTFTTMHIALRTIGELEALTPPIVRALYRAAQEGLTNACKYAQAQQVQVLVYCDDAVAEVRVRDDGRTMPVPTFIELPPDPDGHFGLLGLRERAEQLGGTVVAGPLPEGGFQLHMSIPLG